MDNDENGEVSYNEFCELCEEKRRKIDPFENDKNNFVTPNHTAIRNEALYFTNVDLDTLENMSKLKPLSTSKKS